MAKKSVIEPTFIISLDVELLWGFILNPNSKVISLLENDDKKGRGNINILLSLFERYNIPATWAVVGHLFLDRCSRENGVPHHAMPRFKDDWYSADPCSDIRQDPLYYGRDIIEKVISSPVGHEIGYHSFSHILFSECAREVAEAEVKEGVKLAKGLGITLKSFVFPYNAIGHVDVLRECGFEIFRGKHLARQDPNQSFLIRKASGAIDKVIAQPTEPAWRDGIWEIPSSMFFCDPQIPFSLLPRAKFGLERAIRSNKVFHIFLHPYNLLMQPSLVRDLDKLLTFVSKKRDEGRLWVMTMGGLAFCLNSDRGV
jgi:peptidoglycan/xylan/chitin deacetylase (PgdA/CDA1 family)